MIFPPWFDDLVKLGGAVAGIAGVYVVAVVYFGFSPRTTDVGYMPTQPIEYSHRLHAGELGMDCRYCHNTVEVSAHASIPPTSTCMNCHATIRTESVKLELLREAAISGDPIPWVRVHDLPDYAYFDHSAHVTRGIGCASCHGRVDRMDVVYQAEPLSMGWCLDCHRNPEKFLRPNDQITNMAWAPENQLDLGRQLRLEYDINPQESCSTCHR